MVCVGVRVSVCDCMCVCVCVCVGGCVGAYSNLQNLPSALPNLSTHHSCSIPSFSIHCVDIALAFIALVCAAFLYLRWYSLHYVSLQRQ